MTQGTARPLPPPTPSDLAWAQIDDRLYRFNQDLAGIRREVRDQRLRDCLIRLVAEVAGLRHDLREARALADQESDQRVERVMAELTKMDQARRLAPAPPKRRRTS